MKRYIKYLAGCTLLAALLSGCDKGQPEPAPNTDDGNAVVRLSFLLPAATRAYDALETSVLRLYKVEPDGEGGETEGLIRKYSPATDIPADIYLASGKYRVTVEAGDKTPATFTNKTYHGEAGFTLADHEVKPVEVVCKLSNIAVKVVFDQTMEKFDRGYELYISASDVFSKTEAVAGTVPTLKYTEDGTGYFLMPEGVADISWGFYGSSTDPDIEARNSSTGKIQAPQPGMLYTLTYKFSKFADGYLSVNVDVREYESKHDDHFSFSPQPRVSGMGFSMNDIVAGRQDPLQFQLLSLNPFSSLYVEANGARYDIMTGGVVDDALQAQGITCVMNGGDNGVLTLDEAFFSLLPAGINAVTFNAMDDDGTPGISAARIAVTGATGILRPDLWLRTGTLAAMSTDPAVGEVKIQYREQGTDDEWTVLDAALDADYLYLAAGVQGIRAGHTYELQLLEDGAATGAVKPVTMEAGVQVPDAGFENWHKSSSAFYPYATGGTQFWDTGNPGSTTLGDGYNITTGVADPRPGSSGTTSARLETKMVVIRLAGGNIYVGKFAGTSGMGGIVNFGREFEFNARPVALRVWVKCSGAGTDRARIFTALINMTNGKRYHAVDTNDHPKTKFDVTTADDPVYGRFYSDNGNKTAATLEGHILGYGDTKDDRELLPQKLEQWTMIDIPIDYRDIYWNEKPNTLMITATASIDADQFVGQAGSWMQLDDFEFIY